jgi:Pyridoxamine 5'-phosphate oxidase
VATKTKTPLDEDLARFLESGLAITVATRDGEMQPDGSWAWAVRVEDGGSELSVFLYEEAAAAMLRNLTAHPEIAIVVDQPTSHRACQVKGTFLSSRPARPEERAEIERQVGLFRADLGVIGLPAGLTAGWVLWPATALRVRVTDVFEQTPGPGTGGRLP